MSNSYVKKVEKELEDEKKKALEASNQVYDAQESQARDTFEHQMGESERFYDSLYRENAVQKLINEREIAENMANLGLSDSGLNRTQQTATQLSYANNKKNIDIEKQAALDSFALQMADAISTISQNRIAAKSHIEQNFAQTAAQEATKLYEADVDSYTQLETARIETENKGKGTILVDNSTLSKNMVGGLADNNVSVRVDPITNEVTFIDNVTGKSSTFAPGVNPFTGKKHKDVDNGVHENGYGYQQDNIDGVKVKSTLYKGAALTIELYGREHRIYHTADWDKFYYYDEYIGEYVPILDDNGVPVNKEALISYLTK